MVSRIVNILIVLVRCLELALMSIALWLMSWAPKVEASRWYTRLFRFWCRLFVDALGVNLRLHQKNVHPRPDQSLRAMESEARARSPR